LCLLYERNGINMRNNEISELREKVTIMTPKEGLTEEYCINRINEALKAYIDHDADSDGILYIDIKREDAEKLFNDLFENATFDDYKETYIEEETEGCDIVPMWGLLCDIVGEDVIFNSKTKNLVNPHKHI